MAKENNLYKQCLMIKMISDTGFLKQVAWIPSSFAKVGRNLGFKASDDSWDDGWVVKEVWGSMVYEDLNKQRKAQKAFDWKLGGD